MKAWRARVYPRINLRLHLDEKKLQEMIDHGFIGHDKPSLLTMVRACLGEGRPIHTTNKPITLEADQKLDNIIQKLQQRIKASEHDERTNSENDTGALAKKLFTMLKETEEDICNIDDSGSFDRLGNALHAINQARKLIDENPTVGFHAGVKLTERDQLALQGSHLIEANMTPHMFARFLSYVEEADVSDYDIRCAIGVSPARPVWPLLFGGAVLIAGIILWPILSATAAGMSLGFLSILTQAAPFMIVLLGLSLIIQGLRSAGLFAKADDYETNFKKYDRLWSPYNGAKRFVRNIVNAWINMKHWHLRTRPTPQAFTIPATSSTPSAQDLLTKQGIEIDGPATLKCTLQATNSNFTNYTAMVKKFHDLPASTRQTELDIIQLKKMIMDPKMQGIEIDGPATLKCTLRTVDPNYATYTAMVQKFNARPLDDKIRELRINVLKKMFTTVKGYNTANKIAKKTPTSQVIAQRDEAYIQVLKAQADFERLQPTRADNKRVGLFKHHSFVASTYHIYHSIANVMEEWGKDDPELAVLSLAAWGMMSHYMMAHTIAQSSRMHAILPQNKIMDHLAHGVFSGEFVQNHAAMSSFLTGFTIGKGTFILGSVTDRHGFGATLLTSLSKDPVALCAGMLLTTSAGSAFMLPLGAAGEVAANPVGTFVGASLSALKLLSILLTNIANIYRWGQGLPSIEESRLEKILSSLQAYAGDKSSGSQYQEIINNLEVLAEHPALKCDKAGDLISKFNTGRKLPGQEEATGLDNWPQPFRGLAKLCLGFGAVVVGIFYTPYQAYQALLDHPDPGSLLDTGIFLNIAKTIVTAPLAPLGIAICNLTGNTDKIQKIPGGKLWQILIDHLINLLLRIIQTAVRLIGTVFIGFASTIFGILGTLAWLVTWGKFRDFGTGPTKRFFRSGLHALTLIIEQAKIISSSIADYRKEEGEDIQTKTYDASIIAGPASERLKLNAILDQNTSANKSKLEICQEIINKFYDYFPHQVEKSFLHFDQDSKFLGGHSTPTHTANNLKQGLETCTALLIFYQKNIAAGGRVFPDDSVNQDAIAIIKQYIKATAGDFVSANPIQRFSQAVLDQVYGDIKSGDITAEISKMDQALNSQPLFTNRVKEIAQLRLPDREQHAALLAEMIKAKLLNPKFHISGGAILTSTDRHLLSSQINLVQTADFLDTNKKRQLERQKKGTKRKLSWKHVFRNGFNGGLFLSVFAGVYAGLNAIIFKAAIVGTICAGTAGVAAVIILIGLAGWFFLHQQSGGHNNERIPQKAISQYFQDVAATSNTFVEQDAKLGQQRSKTPPTRTQSPIAANTPQTATQAKQLKQLRKEKAMSRISSSHTSQQTRGESSRCPPNKTKEKDISPNFNTRQKK